MKVIHNFLTDEQVVHSINFSKFWEDKSYYFRKLDYKGFESYDTKNTIGSYIVERMLEDSSLLEEFPFYSACGYEYWPTVLMPGMETSVGENNEIYSLDVHSDYDVARYMKTSELKFPLFGALIYFGNENVEGGLLRVWEDLNYEEVSPTHNTLVVFDSSKLHGVTEVTKGIRKSIAINFWKDPIMLEEGELK